MQREPIRVLHMIASLNIGGSQAMLLNLYRAINRERVQFDFIIDHSNEMELREDVEALGGKIYILPRFRGLNIREIQKAWNEFFSEHKEYRIFHTHSRSYASLYLPIAKKHGLITIAHSHSISNGIGFSSRIKDILQVPIRYQADYLFSCSEKAGKWLFGEKTFRKGNVKVIRNAIDAKKFRFDVKKRNLIRKELGLQNEFVLGSVGRLMPPKNHLFLLECFYEIKKKEKNSKLMIVGDGDLMNTLREKADALGIGQDTIFMGAKKNVEDFYQAMDVFVFPSLWEGLGIAAIEAQASGLHCVVSDAVPKEIDIGSGLVQQLPLAAPTYQWTDAILEIKGAKREDMIDAVRSASYDIEENACWLQEFYLSEISKLFQ